MTNESTSQSSRKNKKTQVLTTATCNAVILLTDFIAEICDCMNAFYNLS